ncbi:MAG: glycosyltransferase family 87 protein [Acidobacteriota bacterium]
MQATHYKEQKELWRFGCFISIAIFILGSYFAGRSGANPDSYSNDFNVYYFAAQEVAQGRTPYDHSLGAWTPYLYLPLLAEVMLPLTLLPVEQAAFLWFLISAAAILLAARMSVSLTNPNHFPSKATWIAAISLVVLLRFIFDNFDYGQVNHVVAFLSVAHFYFDARNKKFLSVSAFVFAASIKLTPLVFIIYHLAKKRWQYAAACASGFVVLTALSFAPFGSRADEAFTVFWKRTIQNQQGFDFAYHGNQSLRAAIERMVGNRQVTDPASATTTVIGLLLIGVAFFTAIRAQNNLAAIAAFFCLTVMLSPLSWKQHFVILILPVVCLIGEALREQQRKYPICILLVLLFALFNLTSPKLIGIAAAEWCEAHSLVFAGALLINIACLYLALRHHSRRLVGENGSPQSIP